MKVTTVRRARVMLTANGELLHATEPGRHARPRVVDDRPLARQDVMPCSDAVISEGAKMLTRAQPAALTSHRV